MNPEINRNLIADRAASAAGVKTFINLADNEETMRGYEGFDTSYEDANQSFEQGVRADLNGITVVSLSGTWREMGRQYGMEIQMNMTM